METSLAFRTRIGPIAAALACLLAAGCSEELGPEEIPSTVAEGIVTFSGKPLDRGWVEFHPIDGTLGTPTSARIGPDGSFRTDRAPVGLSAVRLIDVPIDLPGAVWLFRNSSPIRRTTQSPPGPPMRIDALEEFVQYRTNPGGVR